MLPTTGDTLHVRSTRVVIDGVPTPATVQLEEGPLGPVVRGIGLGDLGGRAGRLVDVGDALVVPAPLDLHFHGCGGHAVPPAAAVESIDGALRAAVDEASWRHPDVPPPAYEWLATLPLPGRLRSADVVSDVAAEVAAAAAAVRHARTEHGTACAGLRVEGLFLNPAKAGVWPPDRLRPPSAQLLEQLHEAAESGGTPLRIIDVAAEWGDAGAELVARAGELGIVASLAHTDATWEQAREAIDAGVVLATHTWNAMRPVTHRDPGVVAAVLADERVVCELICDGVHLHPGTIQLSVRATGHGRWAVVSDASPFAGCPPGDYEWAGVVVHHDGASLRDPAGRLAGSTSLAWAARRPLERAQVPELDAALALGAVPRRVLEPGRPLGLRVGDPAWVASPREPATH